MGCASSMVKRTDDKILIPSSNNHHYNSRETRIVQEEEVDVFIDDEYDFIDNEWTYWSGNYQVLELRGEWKEGISAGGSRNDLESFATNPQYLLSVGPPEKHTASLEAYYSEENKHDTLLISLCLEQNGEKPLSHIAYFIYKADKEEILTSEYFLVVPPERDSGAFVNWRQVKHEFRLRPGSYVIIPATFLPNITREFTISVQALPPISFKELSTLSQLL